MNKVLKCIAFAPDDSTALPSVAVGVLGDMVWSTWDKVFGSIKKYTHDGDLDEDDVVMGLAQDGTDIKAPLDGVPDDHIPDLPGAEPFEFDVYGCDESIYALDSQLTVSAGVVNRTTTVTKRSVGVEMLHSHVDYYPSCIIKVKSFTKGVKKPNKAKLLVIPLGTSAVPMGVQPTYFQPV